MKKALRNYILSDSAITAIVSSRCYTFPAPQSAPMPYILLQRLTGMPERYLSSDSKRVKEFWQIDAYDTTDINAETLQDAIIARLDTCSPFIMGEYNIFNMFVDNYSDLSELELDGGETPIYRKQIDITIIFNKETI